MEQNTGIVQQGDNFPSVVQTLANKQTAGENDRENRLLGAINRANQHNIDQLQVKHAALRRING
ncbi:hypothetical protein BCE02nite_25860 [Brevibacillus centrosporus]|nr:hypothetical protein BCE02nite_25860 [Brevibacillus centrosporus]